MTASRCRTTWCSARSTRRPPDAYPITYQSWVIVYAKQTDAGKAALLKAYLTYLLTDGQDMLGDLDYAPLPASIQDKAVAQLDKITS